MTEDRITALETHLSHQQLALDELNAVVTAQADDIARLKSVVRRLKEQLRAVEDAAGRSHTFTDAPPPHY